MSHALPREFDPAAPARHPLDPLLPHDIATACDLVRTRLDPDHDVLFCLVIHDEPSRDELAAWSSGGDMPPRRVRVTTLNRTSQQIELWLVSITEGSIAAHRNLTAEGVPGQPPLVVDEFIEVEQIVKACDEWVAAVARRGITNIDLVQVDPMSAGNFGFTDEQGLRMVRAVSYMPSSESDNAYAHPIDGLVAYVDLTNQRVLKVVDEELWPVPQEDSNFHDDAGFTPRTDLKPLEIEQPEGPSFRVDGWRIDWQKWSFRVSMNPREGMVLHDVTYDDDGTIRPIVSRLAFGEMVVPYGYPKESHFWRSAFDAGEYGLGALANSLTLGCDCLGTIYYFDAYMADGRGNPYTLDRAICLHEEDFGVLWRGANWRFGGNWVRRARRLVISFWATVGNYDYGFFWYFYQDGTIECEVKLTGIIQTAVLPAGESSPYLGRVGPELAGQHHQHFFCVRIDPSIDGPLNSVVEVDALPVPMGPESPRGNAIRKQTTVLRTEAEGRRSTDVARGRTWLIKNEQVRNDFDDPVAYKLVPAVGAMMIADDQSAVAKRATFAKSALWVTRYDASQRYPSGDVPNLHPGGDGLPAWIAQDRPIADAPIVLWHSFGTTHFARPEDWPVMPVERIGFALKPFGFFRRNPALDVPDSPKSCH